jgi:hypothetical protein
MQSPPAEVGGTNVCPRRERRRRHKTTTSIQSVRLRQRNAPIDSQSDPAYSHVQAVGSAASLPLQCAYRTEFRWDRAHSASQFLACRSHFIDPSQAWDTVKAFCNYWRSHGLGCSSCVRGHVEGRSKRMRQQLILRSTGSQSGPRTVLHAERWRVATLIVGAAAIPQIPRTRHAVPVDRLHPRFRQNRVLPLSGVVFSINAPSAAARLRGRPSAPSLLRRVGRFLTGLAAKIGVCEADASKHRSEHTGTYEAS